MTSCIRSTARRSLALALATALSLLSLAELGHAHEPCHRGLHVGLPHTTHAPQNLCAVCRALHVPGAEAGAVSAFGDLLLEAGAVESPRTPAEWIRPAPTAPSRAPPSLLSHPV